MYDIESFKLKEQEVAKETKVLFVVTLVVLMLVSAYCLLNRDSDKQSGTIHAVPASEMKPDNSIPVYEHNAKMQAEAERLDMVSPITGEKTKVQ